MRKHSVVERPIFDHRSFVHAIIDLWKPDTDQLHMTKVEGIVRQAARIGNLKMITMKSQSFGASAFTIFALLSESHIAIHTWPEYQYVACDVFSCGAKPERAINHLISSLKVRGISKNVFARSSPHMTNARSQFIDGTGPGIRTLLDVKKLEVRQSRYQNIQVLSHKTFGRMLVINNDIQFTESDYSLYDEALMSPLKARGTKRKVLVVGGGDGLCCTYLIESSAADEITLLELDPIVIEICKEHFPLLSRGLNSPRVSVRLGDANKTILKLRDMSFDAVVLDSTAPDTRWGHSTYSVEFLRQIRRVLRPSGRLCANGTSLWFKYNLTAETIRNNISKVFENVSSTTEWIPSFGSPWVFFHASRGSHRKLART